MTELINIVDKINGLRENMNNLVVEKRCLTDPAVLTASKELDYLVNLYMKQKTSQWMTRFFIPVYRNAFGRDEA